MTVWWKMYENIFHINSRYEIWNLTSKIKLPHQGKDFFLRIYTISWPLFLGKFRYFSVFKECMHALVIILKHIATDNCNIVHAYFVAKINFQRIYHCFKFRLQILDFLCVEEKAFKFKILQTVMLILIKPKNFYTRNVCMYACISYLIMFHKLKTQSWK